MPSAPYPENETERLASLHEHDILDSAQDPRFDSITSLAAQICNTPIALITLIDRDRQWFKSQQGMQGIAQTPRSSAFCAYSILGDALLEVTDATDDPRFLDNPLVTDGPGIRFYAGIPLRDRCGLGLGALCVIDSRPRRLEPSQRTALADLAALATALIEQHRAAGELQHSEARFRAVVHATNNVIWDWNLKSDSVWRSAGLARLLGTTQNGGSGESWLEYVHSEDRQRLRSGIRAALAGTTWSWTDEYRLRTNDGRDLHIRDRGYIIRDATGRAVRMVGCLVDVTTQREAERQTTERERRHHLLADLGQRALEETDADALVESATRLVRETLGFEHCRVVELGGDGRAMLPELVAATQMKRAPGSADAETTGSTADAPIFGSRGPLGVLEARSAASGLATPAAIGFVQSTANIIGTVLNRKRADQRLAYVAHFDSLTGLPNRQLFRDRVAHSIKRATHRPGPVAVVVVDLDGFRRINNSHGLTVGDEVLVEVAERLFCVSANGTAGRLAGDEFAVALWNMADIENVTAIVSDLLRSLAMPFKMADGEAFLSAGAGVALYDADGKDADTLIRNAELALHRAKEKGRNVFEFFAPEMNQRGRERSRLEWSLRRAVERREFLLYYQPKVAAHTWQVCGAEALLRWQHPERGIVMPGEFIPVLEETGLIIPVGLMVLETACAQIRAWETAGIRVDSVAVNLSARQFQQPQLDVLIRRIIEAAGVSPRQIEFEITESMLMRDPQQAIQTLGSLKQLGVALSVDDFGTGYSSLAYLKQFPLDALKIAHTFISNIANDQNDAAITRAIIDLAHNLNLKVVAEGVGDRGTGQLPGHPRLRFPAGLLFFPTHPRRGVRGSGSSLPGTHAAEGVLVLVEAGGTSRRCE